MRITLMLCLAASSAALFTTANAQEAEAPSLSVQPTTSPEVVKSPAQDLMEAARTPEADFFTAYEEAEAAGVKAPVLLQARIMRSLATGDLRGLIGMIERIEAARDTFPIGFDPSGTTTQGFTSEREIQGLIDTLKAVRAFQNEDMAAFEEHAKAAYWNWPSWPQLFQLHTLIQQKRGEEVIARYVDNLTLPLDLKLRTLEGDERTLGQLVEGNKALLLDFWASWCGPCIRLMPELQERANTLPEQGVYVAAVNTDDQDPMAKAQQVKTEHNMDMPWLVEMQDQALSQQLMIDSIPRMVLIAPDGKVLFSGHPMDEKLGEALGKLGVSLPGEEKAG